MNMKELENESPLLLDLFCGIGGLSLGLKNSGLRPIGGVDNWEDAARTFEHNHAPLRCLVDDISKVNGEIIEEFFQTKLFDIDVVAGGPPCQGFSTVGERNSSDPRNNLWKHYLTLVSEIRPAYLIIENVEGLAVMESGSVCRQIVDQFALIGYRVKWKLLTSADYAVPQLRKRVIFLGWLDGLATPSFPQPTCTKHVTVADAIFDLPRLGSGEKTEDYTEPAKSKYQKKRRGRCRKLRNHEAAKHSEKMVELLSHIPDGGNRKSIPARLQPRSGFHNSYARLASFKPAVAVTSNMRKPSSARATHPQQPRGLTVREGLRLQTFDDNFEILGTRTSQYLQVGNAVPPLLAEAIGKEILNAYLLNDRANLQRIRRGKPRPVKSHEHAQLGLDFSE